MRKPIMKKKLEEVELFLNTAKQCQDIGDEWAVKARKDLGRPNCETTCMKPGCCYQAVTVTPSEGLMIAYYLDNLGMNTPDYRAELMNVGQKMEASNRKLWLEEAIPCAFLGADDKCKVYPWRPSNCRTYSSWTDPVHCLPQKMRALTMPTSTDVRAGNNIQVIATTLVLAQGVIAASGHSIERPFIRMMPAMVSAMLRAVQASDSKSFWQVVLQEGSMSEETFSRMMQEEQE